MICLTPLVLALVQGQAPAVPPVPRPVSAPLPGARDAHGDQAEAPRPARTDDPFQADDALRKALGLDGARRNADDFAPLDATPALPEMRLRAYVKLADRDKPAAVVDVKGIGTFAVRSGEKLSFSLPGRFTTRPAERRESDASAPVRDAGVVVREQIPIVLRIERVAPDGVVVEVGTLGEFLIIR